MIVNSCNLNFIKIKSIVYCSLCKFKVNVTRHAHTNTRCSEYAARVSVRVCVCASRGGDSRRDVAVQAARLRGEQRVVREARAHRRRRAQLLPLVQRRQPAHARLRAADKLAVNTPLLSEDHLSI